MPVAADLYYSFYQDEETATLPVVLIHGAAGSSLSWGPEIRRLKGYRIYALDLPGHGKSSALDGRQSIADYTSTILKWMEAVKLRRAVFVGHSMGGAIALSLGIDHPDRVLGLGLVSTGVRLRVHPDLLAMASQPSMFYKMIDTLVEFSFGPKTPARLISLATRRMTETRPSVVHGDLLACTNFDVKDQVATISQPVLVVEGMQDQLTPLRYAQYMADTIPDARLHVIPDAGHMLILEQPGEVAAALRDFLMTIHYHPGEEDKGVSGN